MSPLEVLSRVTRLARHLDRQRDARVRPSRSRDMELRRPLGSTTSYGPRISRRGQLLAQTLVTSGTMTNRLDHLEQRGSCAAVRTSTDARSVRVQITALGKRRVDGALEDSVDRENADPFVAGCGASGRRSPDSSDGSSHLLTSDETKCHETELSG